MAHSAGAEGESRTSKGRAVKDGGNRLSALWGGTHGPPGKLLQAGGPGAPHCWYSHRIKESEPVQAESSSFLRTWVPGKDPTTCSNP
ncbi:hypothetical protein JZ751_004163 [Albula glossodonta]|uniref:Uncharacterized protein n=1 Tax=Albula glossodonta TaxID=121402 RepID=A0A8T2P3V9_9TELE|nr:hypothetical protein JZ751_004163 [Albula glossodonta]